MTFPPSITPKVNKPETVKEIPANVIQMALFSSFLTIMMSLTYMALCVLYIIYRINPDTRSVDVVSGSDYFLYLLRQVYIQDQHNITELPSNLTSSSTVYKLVIASFWILFFALLGAIGLLITACDKKKSKHLALMAYLTIIPFLLGLAVDLWHAVNFGMDYSNLSTLLDQNSAGIANNNYTRDMVRLAAIFLVTLSVKGFIVPLLQIIFLITLICNVSKVDDTVEEMHSFNRMSILRGYANTHSPSQEGPALREAREIAYFNRSNSFEPYEPSPSPRRVLPAMPPAMPSHEWQRQQRTSTMRSQPSMPPPPVPIPDYSPEPVRRLKSALKPVYM